MPESCKLYITSTPADELAGVSRSPGGDVVPYDEQEPQRTLQAIIERRPDVVAFDHEFAASTKGLALIERLRGDPLVSGAEIIVALADGTHYRFTGKGAPVPVPARESAFRPVSSDGKTRRAPRIPIRAGVEVLVGHAKATLIDLSILGAQILTPMAPRPGRAVTVQLLEEEGGEAPIKVHGTIAWARFEGPAEGTGPRYRAGIAFTDPDPVAILRYCDRHRG
jgi:hypothetical protein